MTVFLQVVVALIFQLLPPPQDTDIRTVYWELQNRSEVFLTLQLTTRDGKAAPIVTLGVSFEGKIAPARPDSIDVRAYAGRLWAPRPEFWLSVDDERQKLDLAAAAPPGGLLEGIGSDYLPSVISLDTLDGLAEAKRITGNVLGFDVELHPRQLAAIRAFRDRVLTLR